MKSLSYFFFSFNDFLWQKNYTKMFRHNISSEFVFVLKTLLTFYFRRRRMPKSILTIVATMPLALTPKVPLTAVDDDYAYLYCSLFVDIDECSHGTHNCHSSLASCTNTVGSFSCSCNNPYTGDGRTCYLLVSGNQIAEH